MIIVNQTSAKYAVVLLLQYIYKCTIIWM